MGYISFYSTLSTSAVNQDYTALFGKSRTADGDLRSLSGERADIVSWVLMKLGQPIMTVELDKKQIFACFEEANIQFSAIVNTHQIQNWFLTMLGQKRTGNMTGNLPNWNMGFLRGIANRYAGESHPIVGGRKNAKKAYFDNPGNVGVMNVFDRIDGQTGLPLTACIPSLTGKTEQHFKYIKITELYFYPSSTINKYWDTYSISNNFFPSHALMQNWRYRLRPVWQTVLNAQQLQQHSMVRNSSVVYAIVGDQLKVSPIPSVGTRIWFDYIVYDSIMSADRVDIYNLEDKDHDITNIWDAPMYNVPYDKLNSIGKRWVRNYCLRLSKQCLGLVRRKFSRISIPNDSVTLDGGALVQQGIAKQQTLRDQLRRSLQKLSIQQRTRREARIGEQVNMVLRNIPAGIYIG